MIEGSAGVKQPQLGHRKVKSMWNAGRWRGSANDMSMLSLIRRVPIDSGIPSACKVIEKSIMKAPSGSGLAAFFFRGKKT